jgi:hypothetical protein
MSYGRREQLFTVVSEIYGGKDVERLLFFNVLKASSNL